MRNKRFEKCNSLLLALLLLASVFAHPLFHAGGDSAAGRTGSGALRFENATSGHESALHTAGMFCPVCAGLTQLFLGSPEITLPDTPILTEKRRTELQPSFAYFPSLPLSRAPPRA